MRPGSRVTVAPVYGEKFPFAAAYVGREGIFLGYASEPGWEKHLRVKLDGDAQAGLFLPDELLRIPHHKI